MRKMKMINVVRWQISDDSYVDMTDGQIPSVGAVVSLHLADTHVTDGVVESVRWYVDDESATDYHRAIAVVQVSPAKPADDRNEALRGASRAWVNGADEARKRLTDVITEGHRLDARDRGALAFLLAEKLL